MVRRRIRPISVLPDERDRRIAELEQEVAELRVDLAEANERAAQAAENVKFLARLHESERERRRNQPLTGRFEIIKRRETVSPGERCDFVWAHPPLDPYRDGDDEKLCQGCFGG